MFFCGQCGFHLPPARAHCPRCGMAVDVSGKRVGAVNPNDCTILSSSAEQPTFPGVPVGRSWQQLEPFALHQRYPDTEGAVYAPYIKGAHTRPDMLPFLPRQRKRNVGLLLLFVVISFVLISSGIFVAPRFLKMGSGPSPKAVVVAAHFTARADFTTASPLLSARVILIKNDALFQKDHAILDAGGQVMVAFTRQKGMNHVTCTIRGLVSRLGNQDGFAPISLSNNGSAFQTNFTVSGNGFDPNETTFEIPPEQLTSGSNLLELQVAMNATSVFWLYQLRIDQSA